MGAHPSTSWKRAPPELVDAFTAAVAALPALERRQMFGYPGAFANGHLVTSLHEGRWIVRLPDAGLAELAMLGGTRFEPMPGRPMRGYLAFPQDMVADPDSLEPWLQQALDYVLQMPPKVKSNSAAC